MRGRDVLSILRRTEARNILDTAHRVKMDCGQVLRYAVATGRAEGGPERSATSGEGWADEGWHIPRSEWTDRLAIQNRRNLIITRRR
ncbi:phage integrase central domain-containing protein [Pelobacter propionicus]|uniref:phage integrase central domain-containing protein n=1 Tax=Pelobacter propionicus TaxID=29543 RepID=UPI0038CD98F1